MDVELNGAPLTLANKVRTSLERIINIEIFIKYECVDETIKGMGLKIKEHIPKRIL
jgi:hypothetical protein